MALHDGKAVPKIIDFGIAKATQQRLTEKTLFTQFSQLIGTPEYMSPEQAEWSDLDIDTRTDIYSLGVLLYELLTSTTPLDGKTLRSKGYAEMQRIIREEEPTKPSTKLSTFIEKLTDIAKHRKTQPDLLLKLIKGDLDWIVMKSLEKDRTRRYDTTAEFVADIERHLNNEPIEAVAPNSWYKLRKFVRRNRVGIMAGSMVAAALIIGALVSTIGFMQAKRQRDLAEANLRTAESQKKRAEGNLALALKALDEVYMGMIERLPEKAEIQEKDKELCQKALAFYEQFAQENQSISLFGILVEEYPGEHKYRQGLADSYNQLGDLLCSTGRDDEAEESFRQALAIREKLAAKYPEILEYQKSLALSCNNLAWRIAPRLNPEPHDAARAVELAKRAVELAPKNGGYWSTLGVALYRAGRWEDSIEALNKSIELKSSHASNFFFLAMAYWQQDNKEQANHWYNKAVEWMKQNQSKHEELRRFRAETEKLMGISDTGTPDATKVVPMKE